jgi:2-polyprenyl-6-methoxyphenol hydroxylase-like FAD-dependent oxidoreductase
VKEGETGIRVVCSDNSEYEGEILVGADGTNSAIRQGIYKSLKEQGEGFLPPSDDTPLPYDCICLVGQTTPLDVDKFPELKDSGCHLHNMIGLENRYTVRKVCYSGTRGIESES